MNRKRRRLAIILICGVGLGGATAFTLSAFNDNLVFFVYPSDLLHVAAPGTQLRLGGLVEVGSVIHGPTTIRFKVTDGKTSVPVAFDGVLPDLFREGQGVVLLGTEEANGVFRASEVLAKHDETYMPKEVADVLKKTEGSRPKAVAPEPLKTKALTAPTG